MPPQRTPVDMILMVVCLLYILVVLFLYFGSPPPDYHAKYVDPVSAVFLLALIANYVEKAIIYGLLFGNSFFALVLYGLVVILMLILPVLKKKFEGALAARGS
ncbi:hypothetical protein B2J93_3135 [Marssonina coronariae]|uniref:Uncharacterized protein n=1 Tax=Diplocarpon coronariae TaxID=2795749 RepID=A0A218Z2U4_9HELO|nr:hypothetical protein B2J93_3135 [Marssonina coronariae]